MPDITSYTFHQTRVMLNITGQSMILITRDMPNIAKQSVIHPSPELCLISHQRYTWYHQTEYDIDHQSCA